ncbi:MAG TPA: hypothetical protein VLJ39_17715 [Tepidisphaeraceae bacterium]|nr:hypothetical protein [Tepidisphaeraceae bacterium]
MQATPSETSNTFQPGRLWRWVGSGFWAIADQGLFAGSNFLLNVLLTQWLTPNAYGAFAVGFAVLLFVGAIHVALIGEPILVFGPGRYKSDPRAYLGATLYAHILLSGIAMLLMVAVGVVWKGELGTALIGFGLGCPCILLLWMMRRACYMLLAPRAAAIAGLGYLFLMLGGLFALHHLRRISLLPAIAVLDGSNLLAGLGLLVIVRPRLVHVGGSFFRNVLIEHFRFGRWGVGTGVLYFFSGQLFYITLAVFDGLNASA